MPGEYQSRILPKNMFFLRLITFESVSPYNSCESKRMDFDNLVSYSDVRLIKIIFQSKEFDENIAKKQFNEFLNICGWLILLIKVIISQSLLIHLRMMNFFTFFSFKFRVVFNSIMQISNLQILKICCWQSRCSRL